MANTFVANARAFDLFGRWGGDEFIGIIRNVDEASLEAMGNRLRALVENSYIVHDNKKLSVNISIGATLVKSNDTEESLIKRADQLLYNSKSTGRNCLAMG